jgi:hypothetical protein
MVTIDQVLAYLNYRIGHLENDTTFFLNDIEIGQLSAFQEIRNYIAGELPERF